jgi:hypothetical protein
MTAVEAAVVLGYQSRLRGGKDGAAVVKEEERLARRVRHLIRSGKLRGARIEGRYMIHVDDLRRYQRSVRGVVPDGSSKDGNHEGAEPSTGQE